MRRPIFELISENEPPRSAGAEGDRELWTYAQIPIDQGVIGTRHEFRLGFAFWTRDLARGRVGRRLRLDLEKSGVEMGRLFSRKLESVREEDRGAARNGDDDSPPIMSSVYRLRSIRTSSTA